MSHFLNVLRDRACGEIATLPVAAAGGADQPSLDQEPGRQHGRFPALRHRRLQQQRRRTRHGSRGRTRRHLGSRYRERSASHLCLGPAQSRRPGLGAGQRRVVAPARLGGDEFGILLPNLDWAGATAIVADKVLLNFSVPCRVNNHAVIIGGSLGSSFFPDDAADGETLLRFADVAMFQAKQLGRGTHVAFSGSMDRRMQENLRLHVRLKHALDNDGLRLFYQPQVDTESGEIVGCEALLRWHDDELGEVSPARFIPVAEATGLILPLGDWVLETACRQIAMWSAAGTPLKVAVNLSPQQLRQQKLVGKLRQVMADTGAPPELIEIEITETAAMESPQLAEQQLSELASLGIGIAMDDFGTGYSSLGYLKNLPITKLKIDQSFVKGLPDDSSDSSIVRIIIGLAKSHNLRLVAEGVETNAQRHFLQQYGCETYQGWLFSKAVSATEMGAMLSAIETERIAGVDIGGGAGI